MDKGTKNIPNYNGNGKENSDNQLLEKGKIDSKALALTPPQPVAKVLEERKVKNEKDLKTGFNKFIAIRDYVTEKYDIRFNTVSCDYEYSEKGLKQWKEFEVQDLICELMESGFKGVKEMVNPLVSSSYFPRFDPLIYYFETLPKWDESQPDYILQLSEYVETTDNPFFQHQFKMMLVRVVAQALGIIAFNKQCFTLYGKQNDGKTSFLRFLCPPSLQKYIKDGIDFNGNGKDAKRALAENLFINLDELAQLGKADMNTVKEFITTSQVKLRIPYAVKDTVMRRRASFVGSTNKQEILTDDTGNVRWLLFEITSIRHDKGGSKGYEANIDINKVWAQAMALLQSGYRYVLTDDEIKYSERNNQQYRYQSDEMSLIIKYFTNSTPEKGRFLTSTDIMIELNEKTGGKVRTNSVNVGRACSALKFDKFKGSTSRNAVYGYFLEDAMPMNEVAF